MHTCVYISSTTNMLSDAELKIILQQSRVNNKMAGITGILLYHEGSVLQVLEGEKEDILRLFDKISRDPRHKGVTKVIDKPVTQRSFNEWSMAFKKATEEEWSKVSGFLNIKDREQMQEATDTATAQVLTMIHSFSKVNLNM